MSSDEHSIMKEVTTPDGCKLHWSITGTRAYVIEASDFGRKYTNALCPECAQHVNYLGRHFKVGRNVDHDITHWEGRCDCGARLTVFND